MSKLLRYYAPGQIVFITSVTAKRGRILVKHADLLTRAFHNSQRKSQFELVAWVILPDHFHCLIGNPKADMPAIMQRIKLSFSKQVRFSTEWSGPVWQHRYWDHIIRCEEYLRRHIDYIHYNPVRHGLVNSPRLWPHSSFSAFLEAGYYEGGWGERVIDFDENRFGE